MNRVFLAGNLTRDPEVRYLDGGRAVTNFTIAINERNKDGKETTSFIRCAAWGDLGIRVGDSTRMGTRVVVEGRLSQRSWKDKNNATHDDVSVVINTCDVVTKSPPMATPTEQARQPSLDDLPF